MCPSIAALALGTLTGSGKAFEAVYVVWTYAIYQRVSALDFMGIIPESPFYIYALMALGLFPLALFIRQRRLTIR
jgi:hypothetical protein